jgi:gliding motility-associated protein GldC|tara:strand:+ start:38330 stop:38665 length:336 start_codon:yes stop_codon:yes gene_type:complete
MKKSKITFEIELDENHLPQNIKLSSSDGQLKDEDIKSFLISAWDSKKQETLRIDLWTNEMMVNEMLIMYHQTLLSMANSLVRATSEKKLADALRDYCTFFAEHSGIIDSKK